MSKRSLELWSPPNLWTGEGYEHVIWMWYDMDCRKCQYYYLSIHPSIHCLVCFDLSSCYSVILLSFISKRCHRHHGTSGPSVHQLSDGWRRVVLYCAGRWVEGLRSSLSILDLSFLLIRAFICYFCSSRSLSFSSSPFLTCTLSLCCGRG